MSKETEKTADEFEHKADPNYNWKWHNFIVGVMNGEERYVAYAKAYGREYSTDSQKNVCMANASRLLRNANFQKFWQEFLESSGFNDSEIDHELLKLIQDGEDGIKLGAIKHYNDLRQRVIKRVDLTSDGEQIQQPIIVSDLSDAKTDSKTE